MNQCCIYYTNSESSGASYDQASTVCSYTRVAEWTGRGHWPKTDTFSR